MSKLEVYIWGTGKLGRKRFFCLAKHYKICGFYDNDSKQYDKLFLGLPVMKRQQNDKSKIIIASTYWREIAKQLDKQGLAIFDDYIPYCVFDENGVIDYDSVYEVVKSVEEMGLRQGKDIFNSVFFADKKLAVIYGNCQTRIMEKILNLSQQFSKDYIMIATPKMYELDLKRDCILYFLNDNLLWNRIDLFIYQNVKKDNRFLPEFATNRVIAKLKSQCKRINIVNIYFEGYFPQYEKQTHNVLNDIQHSGLFPYGDKYLNNFIKKNMDQREVYSCVANINFIPEDELASCIRRSFSLLEEKEENVDVVISDYIKKFFEKEQLFYSPNHPCNKVLIEYVNRILKKLEYEREELDETMVWCECGMLKGQDLPLYPSVIRFLNLKRYEKQYYPNRYLTKSMLVDFEEYVKYYLNIL